MVRRVSQSLVAWFLLWDLTLTAAGWLAAYYVRFHTGLFSVHRGVPDFALYLRALPLILLAGAITYRFAGMYEIHRLRRFREELAAVGKGVGLMALVVMAISFARHAQHESRGAMVMFTVVTLLTLLVVRRISWLGIRQLRARGVNQSHALVVGTGRLARRTVRTLHSVSWSGIQPVGYVEDDAHRGAGADLPVLGGLAELPELVERHHIEHVFVALPLNRYADARRVFAALSQTVVDVQLIADLPAMAGMTFTTTQIHGMTVIGLRENPHHGLNMVVKRVMDVILACVAIVLLAPLMGFIALLVKLTSPGPLLYRQERCGLNGRSFMMLKFRSMRVDAEAAGPQMTGANDPRRTRLGTVMRATNLDELPQFFNVLWGDMSIVGPRPERPVFVSKFAKTIPNYNARHAVKAGITGWAQVNGWRGNSSLRKRVQFDLYYISHWNPLFDLRIIFLTVWRMLFSKQKHAY
ncbi:UDP-glucose:undecaprenyl-phosphate glucose-1-phosphate transferase [Gemmata obscuriglobus]|uniref:Undecaprenyl-phosphate glucose phosphotransferase n=1 Tax=Gemmata obscuriglobus TaxID=114 RepID=A0A2Z3H7U4_9BACT|nr:undecaprenyl-phosphate glucose phosphotransferase [Gemmata obscuriglobus]AWM37744.1 undecaprenyl-phosphate glucose phosphotransferase [Gemmata obscuriglobus]QEG29445.1 UDP-glucose:undecaprenyl-phosphate glucose-1-phosphate transferase [Gemmata obscuriglobus]VTS08564.1 Sugar transferase OS=uncultured planctomycete GN=HGMM_F16E03C02 PE=4 SV=1: CoA_binding_3: Bac_transf [Gemmata obscuriglobus UQM 2246]